MALNSFLDWKKLSACDDSWKRKQNGKIKLKLMVTFSSVLLANIKQIIGFF